MTTSQLTPQWPRHALHACLVLRSFKFLSHKGLLQEYCNGKTLRSAIRRGLFSETNLPHRWDAIMNILQDICAGMAYVHSKGIVHSDLNPSNVLLKVCCCSSPFAFAFHARNVVCGVGSAKASCAAIFSAAQRCTR